MTIALHSKSPIKFSFAPFGLAALAALVGVTSMDRQQPADAPTVMVETVTVKAGEFSYRAAGDFSRDGMQIDAPLLQVKQKKPIAIMRSQVTEAQYAQCVRENACRATGRGSEPRADVPVVNVSWEDATAYAQWLSAKTGETWRLPTDQEWAFAAGSRVKDDVIETTSTDFGERWIAKYEKESARARVLRSLPNAGTATREEVEAWWATRRHLSPATRSNDLANLRAFYRWARRWEHRDDDPTMRIDAPRVDKGLPRPLGRTDLHRNHRNIDIGHQRHREHPHGHQPQHHHCNHRHGNGYRPFDQKFNHSCTYFLISTSESCARFRLPEIITASPSLSSACLFTLAVTAW